MKNFVITDEQFAQITEWNESHWWNVSRTDILTSLTKNELKKYLSPAKSKRTLLDIGCGFGQILNNMKDEYKVMGVDNDKRCVDYVKKLQLNAIVGSAEKTPVKPKSVDVITAFDMLEHLKYDTKTLKYWNSLLKNDGFLAVAVPMFPWMWGVDDVVSSHYRRYRKKELLTKLEQSGFIIKRVTYFNFWLFPIIALVRVVKRKLKNPDTISHEDIFKDFNFHVGGGLIDFMLKGIFSSEAYMLSVFSFPIGVSMYVFCQKSPESK